MLRKFLNYEPTIGNECFIAPNAEVIGRVHLGNKCSIWFGAVLRGDENDIIIGGNSNIQDNCVVHVDSDRKTIIGSNVTIGHGAIIHGCTLEDNVLVGMGAIILNGAVIGSNTIIAAGALVPENKIIPSGVLCMGSPAKVIRELTEEEIKKLQLSADHYSEHSKNY